MSGNCTCAKCGKKLNRNNRSGYCSQHRHLDPHRKSKMNAWNRSPEGKAWRKQYQSTRNFKDQANAARREHYQENPEIYKDKELRRKYGISLEDKKNMYERQLGICAICSRDFDEQDLCVDHDHETGQVRELLCSRCNFLIGYARENKEICLNAARYLERYQ